MQNLQKLQVTESDSFNTDWLEEVCLLPVATSDLRTEQQSLLSSLGTQILRFGGDLKGN
jgi:hypothetical protein